MDHSFNQTMENSSRVTFFILAAYEEIGHIKYLYFSIIIVLYISIITANSLLIIVILVDRKLHEPMYFFVCNLSVNELYGSTALLPLLLVFILSDVHEIQREYCIVQIFCLYTYGSIEFCSLAVMAYDRYVSICYSLEYHRIITMAKVCLYIFCVWIVSIFKFIITLSLSARLQLCGNVMNKVYCDNYLLVKLACSDTTINNIYGLVSMFVSVALPFVLILYSYAKILKICLTSSGVRAKALNTCTPHLFSLANFSFGCFFEILSSRFDMVNIPSPARQILSVYFFLLPPFLNPIIYGVKTEKVREAFKRTAIEPLIALVNGK